MQCDGTSCISCLLENVEDRKKEESNKNSSKELILSFYVIFAMNKILFHKHFKIFFIHGHY